MRLVCGLLILVLLVGGAGIARAQSNPDLIALLNNILDMETRSLRQSVAHSRDFPAARVYLTILAEKETLVSRLQEIILEIGGEVNSPSEIIELYPTILQALTNDARQEIAIIRACDELLEKYGHPKVRQLVQKTKNTAIQHYMSLTNSTLEVLVSEQVKRQSTVP